MEEYLTNPLVEGNWSFETGDLSFWTAEGDAFENQPTQGDMVTTARVNPVTLGGDYWDVPYSIGHHGTYWIGTAENPLGDAATGTLTSQEFSIRTRYIHFLVAGTEDAIRIRVELQVSAREYARLCTLARDHQVLLAEPSVLKSDGAFVVVWQTTGHNSEVMRQETWDIGNLLNISRAAQVQLKARIKIVDASEHGHINVDHFQFSDELPAEIQPPVWGFADLHCHPMAHLAFGGKFFWGKPTDPVQKIRRCDGKGHGGGIFSGYVLHEIEAKGNPKYRANRHAACCWPTSTSRTHQEMHIDWIRRAYEGGLRLMCSCAVNNQLLEHLMRITPFRSIIPKDDLSVVIEQIEAMKKLVEQQAGWMAIVYSSQEACKAIAQGKLAVVLAVEVDQLGGWKRETDCTDQQVVRLLQMLYDHGIRMMIPIHLADNAFGGCAIYDDLFNGLNYYLNGEYFSVEDGYSEGVQFRLQERPEKVIFGRLFPRTVREDQAIAEYTHIPAGHGHINQKGLTQRGRFLIREMMSRGMIIAVDHMSHKSVDETLDIAEQHDYPVVASHTGFRELARDGATENMKTRKQVERMAQLGGMIAPGLAQGDVQNSGEIIPMHDREGMHDHPGSSQSWASAYLYAVDRMKGKGVALGTDFNGLITKPHPRFTSVIHKGNADHLLKGQRRLKPLQKNAVRYAHYTQGNTRFRHETEDLRALSRWHIPLTAHDEGVYDINTMGLVHYGMIPDFLQDGRNIGLTDKDLTPLFRSAEDCIKMWEKCEQRSRTIKHGV
jgi:microsomal dipeptidase-like Zn-dependent dipeptidase